VASSATQLTLRVYSLANGSVLRSWEARANRDLYVFIGNTPADPNLSLAWIDDGRALAFSMMADTRGTAANGHTTTVRSEIRVLPLDSLTGMNLLDAPVRYPFVPPGSAPPALSCGVSALDHLLFTADGSLICEGMTTFSTVHAKLCPSGHAWVVIGLLRYPATPPGMPRVLQQYTSSCPVPFTTVEPLWTSPSGGTQLGFLRPGARDSITVQSTFGVFQNGRFSPLPLPTSAGNPADGNSPLSYIAW
jgi:hypothetical protein